MELKNISIVKIIDIKFLFLLVFILKSCYPVSHIIIGETQAPINYVNVKVYYDYPGVYEKIAQLKQVVI